MSSSFLAEKVACETALIMLESPVRDKTFGNLEAWTTWRCTYVKKGLSGLHTLFKRRSTSPSQIWFGVIKVGPLRSKELLALLYNKDKNLNLAINLDFSYNCNLKIK